MPVTVRAKLTRAIYPAALAATCALAWIGPTYASGVPGVRLPVLDPLGGGTLAGAAATWGPAFGLSLIAHAKLAASGAPRQYQAVPYVFLVAAAALALPAWLLAPGMGAALLASFAKMTGLLLLGFLAVALGCVDAEGELPSERTAGAGADVVSLYPAAASVPVVDTEAAMPVALAA